MKKMYYIVSFGLLLSCAQGDFSSTGPEQRDSGTTDAGADTDTDTDTDGDTDGDTDKDTDTDMDSDTDTTSEIDGGTDLSRCIMNGCVPSAGCSFDFEDGAQEFVHEPSDQFEIDKDPWAVGATSLGAGCHSGTGCWGTNLNGEYPICSSAALISPLVDLSPCSGTGKQVQVAFWHFLKTETDDGALVQMSTDGGAHWEAVSPDQTYTGEIKVASEICPHLPHVGAKEGWYGDETGGAWEQVTIVIPSEAMVSDFRVRFLFGSNSTDVNSVGWYIDDFEISTQP